jgi:hypothetical protein
MACGLSRSELTTFNISLDENQRCQAIRPGGGQVCNSLLSEHIRDKTKAKEIKSTAETVSTSEDISDSSSSCCGRIGKRSVHTAQVVITTYLVITCFLAVFISGINFEVDTSEVSNLMIDGEADALQFWYRTHKMGLSVIEHANNNDEHGDEYREVEDMYVYSSIDLNDYNCGINDDCTNTVDDLSDAWNTLVVASSVSALLCITSWLLAAPRNLYSCLYNTKLYQTGVREEKKVLMWFVKPIGLTYLLSIMYIVVFGVQFVALFKYINQLPSNEDIYDLSLHYLNSDPTLCSVMTPCEFSYESVDTFNRNVNRNHRGGSVCRTRCAVRGGRTSPEAEVNALGLLPRLQHSCQ